MLNKIKNILIIIVILYYIYKYVGYDYINVPISTVEKLLSNNTSLYDAIYIDEIKKIAYMRLNSTKNMIYRTSFSNHENFGQFIRNLVKDNYQNLEISYNTSGTFTDLIYNIVFNWIGISILFSIIQIIIPKSKMRTIGQEEDDDFQSNEILSFFPSSSKSFYTIIKNSNSKFKDVIGLKTVKEDLGEFIKYLQFDKLYRENGCYVSKGLLFVGPPGVGKTFMAKALASESNATFIYTTGSNFNEIYMGMGSKRVRQLFKYARQNSPCIIFIDEIDAIGSRTISLDKGELNKTINALLAELDGMIDTAGILVIGATNLDELLDPALTRSGRFDKKIVFDYPTLDERIELFKLYLSKIKLDSSFNHDNDVKLLAKRTARLTGADIKNICNQGILNHMKNYKIKEEIIKKNKILQLENTDRTVTGCTLKDLNNALDDIGIGNLKTEKIMTEKEKKQVAYHEAGHTLISCLIEHGSIPLKVSIIPRGHSLGFTQPDPVDKSLIFKKELLANICITLGGRGAEKIIFADITTGASDDLKKVSEMVKKYYMEHCFTEPMHITFSEKLYSDKYLSVLNYNMENLINTCFKLVCNILHENTELLNIIANKLLEKETINNTDLLEIIPKNKIASYPTF